MGEAAAVVGGGIAGLLAANVLSEFFERVVLFERDELPDAPAPRKGVPQARHVHVLLAAGASVLDELLPGLFDDIAALGGFDGRHGARQQLVSLRHLEAAHRVRRQRAHAEPRCAGARATHASAGRAAGVASPCHGRARDLGKCKPRLEFAGERQEFDLLVDAAGRGSRLSDWLEASGYARPREEKVRVDVSYTTARYRPRRERDWQALLVYPHPPAERRAGGVFPIEDGVELGGLFGWCGERAEPNDAAFADYARSLPQPEVAEYLEHAERVSDFSTYLYREARWLHYEELGRSAPRTCALGDAVCSVDPVFGQGMTVAALSARLLRDAARAAQAEAARFAPQFAKRLPSVCQGAWLLSTAEDFRYPQVGGKRPFGTPLSHWYTRHVHRLCGRDDDVYRRFARVMHLLDSPASLFHPSVVGKVLLAAARGDAGVAERPRSV
ncbi:MAG: hypothetical protein QM756_41590 [Polyangiaceae bacterium]